MKMASLDMLISHAVPHNNDDFNKYQIDMRKWWIYNLNASKTIHTHILNGMMRIVKSVFISARFVVAEVRKSVDSGVAMCFPFGRIASECIHAIRYSSWETALLNNCIACYCDVRGRMATDHCINIHRETRSIANFIHKQYVHTHIHVHIIYLTRDI